MWRGKQNKNKQKERRNLGTYLPPSSGGDDLSCGCVTLLSCQSCFCDQIGAEQLLSPLHLKFVSQHTVVGEEMSSGDWDERETKS